MQACGSKHSRTLAHSTDERLFSRVRRAIEQGLAGRVGTISKMNKRLIPSPTIATLRFFCRRSVTHFAFCSGRSSPTASSTPRSRPTDEVTLCESPLSKTVVNPICRIAATAFLASGRRTSGSARCTHQLQDVRTVAFLIEGPH